MASDAYITKDERSQSAILILSTEKQDFKMADFN